jgi:regulatory protein
MTYSLTNSPKIRQNKFAKVWDYFLYLLAKKDYSEYELITKANLKNYPILDTKNAIIKLKEKNFLNEERLAETIILKYNICGPQFWSQKMKMARIKPEIIEKVLSSGENTTDLEELKNKIISKFRITSWQLNLKDIKTKQKISRYLFSRGVENPVNLLQTLNLN